MLGQFVKLLEVPIDSCTPWERGGGILSRFQQIQSMSTHVGTQKMKLFFSVFTILI